MQSTNTKPCPYCSEEILATAIKCKHCHSMLVSNSNSIETGSLTATRLAFTPKYEIIQKIGSGGMANVYKARQKSLGRLVALKIFHQSMMNDSELFERFQREARICATLKHPNIVDVYDVGYEKGFHFISMEYIHGINLLQMVRQKGNLEPELTIKIVLSIAEALDYAHSKEIIHRDIKSSNILISEEGKIYLTDFGIAHAAYEAKITLSQEALGTPEYMSPEQIEMEDLDGRSDYYSLGVVMYECLTGHVPFSSPNPLLVLDKIRKSETPNIGKELPDLDRNIVLANLSLLDKNKKSRISSYNKLSEIISMNNKNLKLDLDFASDDTMIHKLENKFNSIKHSTNPNNDFKNLLIQGYEKLSYPWKQDEQDQIFDKLKGMAEDDGSESFLALNRLLQLRDIIIESKNYAHARLGVFVFLTNLGCINSIFNISSIQQEQERFGRAIVRLIDVNKEETTIILDGAEGGFPIVSEGDKVYFGCPLGVDCMTGAFFFPKNSDRKVDLEKNTKMLYNKMKNVFIVK